MFKEVNMSIFCVLFCSFALIQFGSADFASLGNFQNVNLGNFLRQTRVQYLADNSRELHDDDDNVESIELDGRSSFFGEKTVGANIQVVNDPVIQSGHTIQRARILESLEDLDSSRAADGFDASDEIIPRYIFSLGRVGPRAQSPQGTIDIVSTLAKNPQSNAVDNLFAAGREITDNLVEQDDHSAEPAVSSIFVQGRSERPAPRHSNGQYTGHGTLMGSFRGNSNGEAVSHSSQGRRFVIEGGRIEMPKGGDVVPGKMVGSYVGSRIRASGATKDQNAESSVTNFDHGILRHTFRNSQNNGYFATLG